MFDASVLFVHHSLDRLIHRDAFSVISFVHFIIFSFFVIPFIPMWFNAALTDLPTNSQHPTSMVWYQVCRVYFCNFPLILDICHFFSLSWTSSIFPSSLSLPSPLPWYYFLVAVKIIMSRWRVVSVISSGNFNCFPRAIVNCQSVAVFNTFDFLLASNFPFHPVFTIYFSIQLIFIFLCSFFYCHCNLF